MTELERTELELLIEGLQRVHGYDLRVFSRPLLAQGLRAYCERRGHDTLSQAQGELLRSETAVDELAGLVGKRERRLFEDPAFWAALRRHVVPVLRTYPSLKIWQVECGAGQDACALAILLEEEGLLGRARIYATSCSDAELERARRAQLTDDLADAEERYQAAGGAGSLEDFFVPGAEGLTLKPSLRATLFFAQHHLETDSSFNEFQLVLCQDVLLRFNRPVHERIHGQLFDSLSRFGFLALGRKESVTLSPHVGSYEELEESGRLFRRAA